MITRARASHAAALARAISLKEHSPAKRWTAYAILASLRVWCQASVSRRMADGPATIKAGPCSPSRVISAPSAAVAFLPWVYLLGDEKTVSMAPLQLKDVAKGVPLGA